MPVHTGLLGAVKSLPHHTRAGRPLPVPYPSVGGHPDRRARCGIVRCPRPESERAMPAQGEAGGNLGGRPQRF